MYVRKADETSNYEEHRYPGLLLHTCSASAASCAFENDQFMCLYAGSTTRSVMRLNCTVISFAHFSSPIFLLRFAMLAWTVADAFLIIRNAQSPQLFHVEPLRTADAVNCVPIAFASILCWSASIRTLAARTLCANYAFPSTNAVTASVSCVCVRSPISTIAALRSCNPAPKAIMVWLNDGHPPGRHPQKAVDITVNRTRQAEILTCSLVFTKAFPIYNALITSPSEWEFLMWPTNAVRRSDVREILPGTLPVSRVIEGQKASETTCS